MIAVRLDGGLGNQLFQYAAARALADRRRTTLAVDARPLVGNRLRQYGLGAFRIRAHLFDPHTPLTCDDDRDNDDHTKSQRVRRTAKRARAHLERLRAMRVVDDPHFHFAPAVFDADDDVYLRGYFQSPKYFSDDVGAISADLTLATAVTRESAEVESEMNSCASVAIHIRRGDYVADKAVAAAHGALSASYYEHALAHLVARVPVDHLFVFSDEDVSFPTSLPVTFVRHNRHRAHEDLALLSSARHHIIANSTFSWWGAFLRRHHDGVRIAPQTWFAGLDADTSDLFDSSWTRI